MPSKRLPCVLQKIDHCNNQDPNQIRVNGELFAKELIYGKRMSTTLERFKPHSSEYLQIACRAQHIERWVLARATYPMNKVGYKKWRTDLARHHATVISRLMADCGFDSEEQQRVADILQKKQLKRDADTQTLEDVACLVFLEHYLPDFAQKHTTEKLIDIIQKTWRKMSNDGHQAALQLSLPDDMNSLVGKALAG